MGSGSAQDLGLVGKVCMDQDNLSYGCLENYHGSVYHS